MKIRLLPFLFFLSVNTLFSQNNIFLPPQSYNLDKYTSIKEHFSPPSGFQRVKVDSGSFAAYLRKLPVVPDTNNVLDFKNRIRIKEGDSSLAAIVPIAISGKRLWQCMDILIALKIEYLKNKNRKQQIEFPLPDGTELSWSEWRNGIRVEFKGANFYKNQIAKYDESSKNFTRYLNTIFSYSNTQTFYHNYPQQSFAFLKPGDFITKKGKKGHAVLIVDLAINDQNEKVALIGQGDTPACQFYLLKNKDGSAWFKISPKTNYPDLPIRKKMYWSGLRRFTK